MQLPDESIYYQYQTLLVPPVEEWTPAAEMRAEHYLHPDELRDLMPRLLQVRSQIAAERELRQVPPEMQPLDSGFLDSCPVARRDFTAAGRNFARCAH